MARQKTVFQGKQEVAHVWARQEQYDGREGDARGGRIFFEGPTIFSYGRHFPIATFHQRKGQEKIVLFTTDSRSVTTEAHKRAVRDAVSHFRLIYCVNPQDAAQGRHGDNMRDFERRAELLALKLAKAVKPEKYLSQIGAIRRKMEDYAAYFKIGKRQYRFNYLLIESKEAGQKATAEEIKARKAYKKRVEMIQKKLAAKRVAEFRSGERDSVEGSEWTYLRYNNVGHPEIRTSKGLRFNLPEAQEFYSRLKRIQSKCKEGYEFNFSDSAPEGMPFDGYALLSAGPEYFEIGCHKITWSELDAVAQAAGFSAEAVTA